MPDTFLAIQTLGFATGTVLFGMLVALSRRSDRPSGQHGAGLQSAWLGLLWNAGMLAEYAARLAGYSLASLPMRMVSAAAYTALALLPTVFLIEAVNRYERWRPLPGRRWLLVCSWAIGSALTLNLFAEGLGVGALLFWPYLLKTIAYNLVLHLAVMVILFQRTQHFPARSFVRAELWLLIGLATTLMLSIHLAFGTPAELAIKALSQQSGIPIAITAIASLSRFRFADVFIKRSFTILAAVVTVLIYSLLVIRPLLRLVRASARYPEAASWVVMTLLGCALLLAFPAIKRLIYRMTDRRLFQRPNYNRLAQALAIEIERAEDEPQLFGTLEQQLQSALQVETVRIVPYSRADPPEASMLLPVKVNAGVGYLLAVDSGREGRKLLSDELAFLASLADRIGRRIETLRFERERREREMRETRLQHLLTRAELRALQAQINPHFLFNTLNTIADLIGSEPEKAELMTERLAEVFRYVLAQTETSSISVRDEFDFLRTYLAIEQVRFGERLQVELMLDPAVAHQRIPPLILQPIVENALKHGLSPKREGGRLGIYAGIEDNSAGNRLRLTVEDDGIGWNEVRSSTGTGIGLKNVRERLQAAYDGQAELRIDSDAGQGARISIIIPDHEAQNVDHRRRSAGPLAVDEAARRIS